MITGLKCRQQFRPWSNKLFTTLSGGICLSHRPSRTKGHASVYLVYDRKHIGRTKRTELNLHLIARIAKCEMELTTNNKRLRTVVKGKRGPYSEGA